jgi:hypothetical protein
MSTTRKLAYALGPIVGLQPTTIERAAEYLRSAGLMQPDGELLTPEHAAALLIAIVAGRSPTEAVAALTAMGWLPLVLAEATQVHPDLTTTGEGRCAGDASLNPISFMGDLIQRVIRSGGNYSALGLPDTISLTRGEFHCPAVCMEFRGQFDAGLAALKLDFADFKADARDANTRMVTQCLLPGSVIETIAAVF